MKLDILAITAHPDDAELSAAGTMIAHVKQGKKVGIVDLTKGELGTNGSVQIRKKEAHQASRLMGLRVRKNLGFSDGFFVNDRTHQLEVIKIIRRYRPEVIITNAPQDRHPDHVNGAELVKKATFLSGLQKIETALGGLKQKQWRPSQLYHIVQSQYLQPNIIVDISNFWERKVKVLQAYPSQFYVEGIDSGQKTYISTPQFMEFVKARAREYGQAIGVTYGEGFIKSSAIGARSLFDLL